MTKNTDYIAGVATAISHIKYLIARKESTIDGFPDEKITVSELKQLVKELTEIIKPIE